MGVGSMDVCTGGWNCGCWIDGCLNGFLEMCRLGLAFLALLSAEYCTWRFTKYSDGLAQ